MRSSLDEHLLGTDAWLDVLQRDYLASFVRHDGSAVKVVVAELQEHARVRERLQSIAAAGGFQYAHVDAGTTRTHYTHALSWEVARQIPWPEVATRFMRLQLDQKGIRVPASGDLSIDALAEASGEARELVARELRGIVSNQVIRDYRLSREFRLAASVLCQAVYDRGADLQQQAADVTAWLTGRLPRIGALRRVNIFRKIGRANARQVFYSIAAWLRAAGYAGLVVSVDIARYALGKDAAPDGLLYSKGATLDMHEVLRQFVDGSDEMTATLLVFQTGPAFLTSEERGLRNYDALRLRLTDDVRDRRRPNPLAPMVRLRTAA